MPINKIILGDNLETLRTLDDESADLIYLDPPFFSNKNYEVIWGDEGEIRSFKDRWAGGIEHYIAWLKERVYEMYRVLKKTGSLYLHCDWHADAYIRTEVLDKIFGAKKFIAEIVWTYSWGVRTSNRWNRKHDIIYNYSKGKKFTFNADEVLEERTFSDSTKKRLEYKGALIRDRNNRGDSELALPSDVWYIATINGMSKERIGYPTQKPEALLERIIKASSNPGDLVLDPFVGGGTTVAVADKLGRHWIGIDQSVQAVKVTELRLQKQQDLLSDPFSVHLYKYDYDTLRYQDSFEFEEWIVRQYGGAGNVKQRGDYGIDGRMPDNTPIQVKRSDNVGRNVLDNFMSAVRRYDKSLLEKNRKEKKPVGHIIAFSFNKGIKEEAARLKNRDGILINLITVEEIVPIAKKPVIHVKINEISKDKAGVRELELTAEGTSEAGIEFYSWDFSYEADKGFKAAVIRDAEGKQRYHFPAGVHYIAVKVVDNDGLESLEVIKLQINGKVTRKST
jgi:DNA modification methylase